APDVTTEEGKAVVREYLDQLEDAFVSAIAEGRSRATGAKVTAAMVRQSYGRGATLLASAALDAGLIDAKPQRVNVRSRPRSDASVSRANLESQTQMTFEEFQNQFPQEAARALDAARVEACAAE